MSSSSPVTAAPAAAAAPAEKPCEAASAAPATLVVIGAGAMGGAIVRGLVASGTVAAVNVLVSDLDAGRLEALSSELGVATTQDSVAAAATHAALTILAVKPQVLPGVMEQVAPALKGCLVVSIAAGVPLSTLELALSTSRVVRVMPNLPLAQRKGATAVCPGALATPEDIACVTATFEALGCAAVMSEATLDVEGAVVGCAPAYFALIVDAFTRAAVRRGMPARDARTMLATTMAGVGEALVEEDLNPRIYMERVTSPAGTTAEGLYELEPLLMEGAYAAVDAALERTRELAGK